MKNIFHSNRKSTEKENGSALITLLFFATIITFVAGNVAVMARNQLHVSRIIIDRTAAQQIAEGAAAQALAYISEDPQNTFQPPSEVTTGTIGNGTYQVNIQTGQFDLFTIVSTGTVRDQSRTVRVHARTPIDPEALNKAMFSNGEIEITGTGDIFSSTGAGDIHANQDVDMGGNTAITGNASAVGNVTVKGAASVGGQLMPGSRQITFPKINLDYYYEIAQNNGEVHIGDLSLSDTTRIPSGGVLWVVGDVHFSSYVTFEGLLVATGDIHQAGHLTHSSVGDFPAIISRDGNIHLSGQTEIEGLIFLKSGRMDITGGTDLRGAIVAWGDIKTRGNWGLINFSEQEPEMEGENKIEILAWEF